jgi:hypothetical protein
MRFIAACLVALLVHILYFSVRHALVPQFGRGGLVMAFFTFAWVDIWLQVARWGPYRAGYLGYRSASVARVIAAIAQIGLGSIFLLCTANLFFTGKSGGSDLTDFTFAASIVLAGLFGYFGMARLPRRDVPAEPFNPSHCVDPTHGSGTLLSEPLSGNRQKRALQSQERVTKETVPVTSDAWDLTRECSFYEIAIDELRSGTYAERLWERAYTHARGDLRKATSFYLNLRVLELSANRESTEPQELPDTTVHSL